MSVDTTFVSFLLCYYAVGLFFCDAAVVIITVAGRHRQGGLIVTYYLTCHLTHLKTEAIKEPILENLGIKCGHC